MYPFHGHWPVLSAAVAVAAAAAAAAVPCDDDDAVNVDWH